MMPNGLLATSVCSNAVCSFACCSLRLLTVTSNAVHITAGWRSNSMRMAVQWIRGAPPPLDRFVGDLVFVSRRHVLAATARRYPRADEVPEVRVDDVPDGHGAE